MPRSLSRIAGALLLSALLAACGGVQPPPDEDPRPGDPPPRGAFHDAPVAVGERHTLAVTADGYVAVAGLRTGGRLGDGSTTSGSRSTPFTLSEPANVVAVAAGTAYSLALTESGELWAWGVNTFMQLGRETDLTSAYAPVKVPFSVALVAIAAAGRTSWAIDVQGRLWAWGDDPTREPPTSGNYQGLAPGLVAGVPTIAALSTSPERIVMAGTDGTLWQIVIPEVWSDLFVAPQQLALPIPGAGAVAVAAHDNHALALLDDGTVIGWGWSGSGQLGSTIEGGGVDEPTHLADLDGLNVVGLYTGDAVSALLTDTGDLMLMGYNLYGLLGTGEGPSRDTPEVALSDVAGFALGEGRYALAVTDDGTVYAWGNADPALGLGELEVNRIYTPTAR